MKIMEKSEEKRQRVVVRVERCYAPIKEASNDK